MVDCSSCANEALYGDHFCRGCGEELPDEDILSCDCGVVIQEPDNFCHSCGTEFEGVIEAGDDEEGVDDDDEEGEEPEREEEPLSQSGQPSEQQPFGQ
jgi:hypothetical protein